MPAFKNATSCSGYMDLIGRFVEECVEHQRGARTRASSLYEAYRDWCVRNGEEPEKSRTFGSALTERGFVRKKQGITYYLDVRLAARSQ